MEIKNLVRLDFFKEDGSWAGYVDCCDAYHFMYDDTYSKMGWRWVEFKAKYTPLQNINETLFRLLAPKELD